MHSVFTKKTIKAFLAHIWRSSFINNKKINRNIYNLLLIFPYGIGNTILANGAFKNLKKFYPKVRITAVYMEEPTKDILSILGGFENVIYWNSRFSFKEKFDFIKFIKRKKFDMAILFYANHDYMLNLLLLIAGIPVRIGFEFLGHASDIFLSHSIKYDAKKSEFQNDLDLLSFLQIPIERSIVFNVKRYNLPKVKNGKLKIGVHIGRPNERRPGWPKNKFLVLIQRLIEQYDADIFIFGGRNEKEYTDYFAENIKYEITDLIDTTTMEQTISYISQMDLFISNDTGLMHIAASQGVPLIAIFGPTDLVKSHPIVEDNRKLRIITRDLLCRPCYSNNIQQRLCQDKTDCLMNISVEDVLVNVDEIIRNIN